MNTRNTVDPRAFRDACGAFATGVTVVSTVSEDLISAMTANAFMSISLDPPMIAVSLGLNTRTLGVICSAGRFAVAILPAETERCLAFRRPRSAGPDRAL
ncbi:putative flavin reductase [Aquamicrobium terrae]